MIVQILGQGCGMSYYLHRPCLHFMFKCKLSQNVQTFQFSTVSFLHNMDVPHIRDISQLVFWVPINNGNSEPNAEAVVDEVVEAEVLVLGAGMDVFCDNFETQIMTKTSMRVT